ncbi:hypothetical protein, partial [Nesterenkonia flava]
MARRRTKEELIERRTKATQYRAAGMTWEQVANKLDYANKSAAWKDVVPHLQAEHNEAVEHLRVIELERLDQLTKGVFPKALKGDTKAVDAVLKIMARRARYIGGLEVPEEHKGLLKVRLTVGLMPPGRRH